jgi:hypothetical protein
MKPQKLVLAVLLVALFAGCGGQAPPPPAATPASTQPTGVIVSKAPISTVENELKKLAPVTLTADVTQLPASETEALKKLVKAAKLMDEIFLRQVYKENVEIREALQGSTDPQDKTYLELFTIMFGPFDRLENDKPFINNTPKPPGANFYPEDMTKEEFSSWVQEHPQDKEAFESNFTVVRHGEAGLFAIPYSTEYKEFLEPAVQLLQEAADTTSDPTLKKYLTSRAAAFVSNDYFQSDMDWMDLAGPIEFVIGPYEVYEDELFGYKASFESFVTIVDEAESKKLAVIGKYLDDMERNLPIPDQYKNFHRGKSSPIKVVEEVFTAGDTKAGIQTTAFNLPNDEKVREAKGSKKVMLKNVAKAKFEKCWIPIANIILSEKDLANISFDSYFNHMLMHEVSHGLGPGNITLADGTKTTVNKALKELYPTIEECKADVLGLYNMRYLIEKKVLPQELAPVMYSTYLGGMFRSIRFGIDEAHGGGVAIQFNWMMQHGAFVLDGPGRFTVEPKKCEEAIRSLAEKLLLIEAKGDYERAKELIDAYKVMTPIMADAVDRLKNVPVDIRPVYPFAEDL